MSIRMMAKELYGLQQEIEKLEEQISSGPAEASDHKNRAIRLNAIPAQKMPSFEAKTLLVRYLCSALDFNP